MICIKALPDNCQLCFLALAAIFVCMVFSKTFGYALRSVLYIASLKGEQRVQLNEVASELNIPRHFLGKVMIRLAKENILSSMKGPSGGFSINNNTLQTPLLRIADLTGESVHFESCVLRLRKCNSQNPCPLHYRAMEIRNDWLTLLEKTTIGHLLDNEHSDLIKSISLT